MTSNDVIYQKIIEKSKRLENECLEWQGFINDKNICYYTPYKTNQICIHRFVWMYHNTEDIITSNEYIHKTCSNFKCNEISHLEKRSRKQAVNKNAIWERLLLSSIEQKSGCIEWTGRKNGQYGISYVSGYPFLVHRISYWIHSDYETLTNIPQKDGDVKMVIRHLCNNHICFNPEHLNLGTQYENDYDDKLENGTLQRGETHYNSTITEEKAREIKLSKRTKEESDYVSQKARAEKFGVSLSLIKSIDCGKAWAFIPDREGNISDTRKIKARKLRKNAKNKVWSDDMWNEARKRIDKYSVPETENNIHLNSPCILWTGNISHDGYGRVSCHGIIFPVHSLSCSIKIKQQRPDNLVTRHLCGIKLCVNPDHLEFGTHSENAIDNVIHNKSNRKFSDEQIIEIRNQSKVKPMIELSKMYNVGVNTISNIIKKKSYKHV